MKIKQQAPAQQARSKAYMPVTDQLDAIYKFAEAMLAQGTQLPAETMKWVQHCRQVKARYPR